MQELRTLTTKRSPLIGWEKHVKRIQIQKRLLTLTWFDRSAVNPTIGCDLRPLGKQFVLISHGTTLQCHFVQKFSFVSLLSAFEGISYSQMTEKVTTFFSPPVGRFWHFKSAYLTAALGPKSKKECVPLWIYRYYTGVHGVLKIFVWSPFIVLLSPFNTLRI